jgi:hypothetical protein
MALFMKFGGGDVGGVVGSMRSVDQNGFPRFDSSLTLRIDSIV